MQGVKNTADTSLNASKWSDLINRKFSSGISIWLAWLLVTSFGSVLGFGLDSGLRPLFSWDVYDFYFMLVAIFIPGLLIGLGQWLILRRRFSGAWGWIPATAIVLPIGIYIGFLGPIWIVPGFAIELGALHDYLIAGFTAGLLLGVFQWLSLRTGFRGMFRWILVSILSWAIGISLPMFILDTYAKRSEGGILDWLAFGLFVGATVGAISGVFVKPCFLNLEAHEPDIAN